MKSSSSSQQSTYTASTSALMEGLQPTLRNALNSLNVNLDYELARYRHARQGHVLTPNQVTPPQFQRRRRSLDLITVPAPKKSPQRSQTQTATPPPPPPNPRIHPQHSADPVTPQQSDDLAAYLGTSTSEVAALRSALVQNAPDTAETYLASSQKLLETFPSPDENPIADNLGVAPEKGWFTQLNTPLGLGSLLLLLVASASFGFALVNPSVVQHLLNNTPLARFWAPAAESTADGALSDAENGEPAEAFQGHSLNPLSPDLSKKEFTELDLHTLSTVPANTAQVDVEALKEANGRPTDTDAKVAASNEEQNLPAPASSNIPTVSSIPQTTTAAPQRSLPAAPTYEAAPAYTPPAPAPEPAPAPAPQLPADPAPVAASQPASPYYVVTDYTGDPSLDTARGAIEDAYVRNFDDGARIQMGAFSSEEGASALVEELKNQGIEAQVYTP